MDKESVLKVVDNYIEKVLEVVTPTCIMLYGSHAKGTATSESDIDIAVVFDGYTGNWIKDSAMLWSLARECNILIEPVIFDSKRDSTGFLEEVYLTGEVVYEA